jgi:hypothetical protein
MKLCNLPLAFELQELPLTAPETVTLPNGS